MAMMDQQGLRKWEARCIQEEAPRCQAACPLHVDARGLCAHLAEGKVDQAWAILCKTLPLPGVLARICDGPCQRACLRTETDGPGSNGQGGVNIHSLERYCAQNATKTPRLLPLPSKNKKAAVLGAGVAGLCAAWELARKGFAVSLYGPRAQGLLAGLDAEVLPPEVLDGELERMARLGVTRAGDDLPGSRADLDALLAEYTVAFADPEACEHLELGTVDDLSLGTATPGLFSACIDRNTPVSPIILAGLGRRAANSVERFVQGASLTANRDKEGPYETRLWTNTEQVEPVPPVPVPAEGYGPDAAQAEAARCLQCQCLECVKNCVYLEHYQSYPKVYARRIYNNASIVMGMRQSNTMINSCMLCGLCEVLCPEDFSMADLCLTARRDMVEHGRMPPSAHEFALRDMAHANGPEAALAKPAPGADTCGQAFFPGCQWTASDPDSTARTYELLRTKDPAMGLLLHCCNIPALWSGRDQEFAQAMQELREQWQAMGSPRLVASCPACLRTLREHLPESQAESLWAVLDEDDLPKPEVQPLTLHDPCTARHDKPLQDAVRSLLDKMGVEFSEPDLTREITECCGYGGLLNEVDPDLAAKAAEHRAQASDADFVTYCAMCRDMLAKAGKRVLHVMDLFPGADGDPAARPAPGYSERRENRARLKDRLLAELWSEPGAEPQPFEAVRLDLSPEVAALLDQRRILASDLQKTLLAATESGRWLVSEEDGRHLAYHRPRNVTYWVEYLPQDHGFQVLNAWSHRMQILGRTTGKEEIRVAEAEAHGWKCSCGQELVPGPTELDYLGNRFVVELHACPDCGQVLVPEPLARGKMAEVEKLLEDK